jgi:hypothetical protein
MLPIRKALAVAQTATVTDAPVIALKFVLSVVETFWPPIVQAIVPVDAAVERMTAINRHPWYPFVSISGAV